MTVDRRKFLGSSAALGAVITAEPALAAAPAAPLPA